MTRTWSGATNPTVRPPLATALRQALLLLALATALAAGRWALWGPRLPLRADASEYEIELSAPLLDVPTARRYYDEGIHLFVDTRESDAGIVDSVPGAFVIRSSAFDDDLRALLDVITPEDSFILFGDGNLALSNNVAARLVARGYPQVELLKGGLEAWRTGGGPVSSRAEPEASP